MWILAFYQFTLYNWVHVNRNARRRFYYRECIKKIVQAKTAVMILLSFRLSFSCTPFIHFDYLAFKKSITDKCWLVTILFSLWLFNRYVCVAVVNFHLNFAELKWRHFKCVTQTQNKNGYHSFKMRNDSTPSFCLVTIAQLKNFMGLLYEQTTWFSSKKKYTQRLDIYNDNRNIFWKTKFEQ